MRRRLAWGAALLVLSGCGTADSSADQAAGPAHAGAGTVIEAPGRDPELCLGGVADSRPPQCRGVPLRGWDWTAVPDEETANGTTWGDFSVVGNYDGTTLTLTEPAQPDPAGPVKPESFTSPCPEPAGGWQTSDPARAGQDDIVAATVLFQREADAAALWIDRRAASGSQGALTILNVAFTGDLERHERDLRTLWGGPLCVLQLEHTSRELTAAHEDLARGGAAELGLQFLGSSVWKRRSVVQLSVVTVTPQQRQALDERYGPGLVDVVPELQPLDESTP